MRFLRYISTLSVATLIFSASFGDVVLGNNTNENNDSANKAPSAKMLENNKQLVAVGLTKVDNLVPSDIDVNSIKLTAAEKHQAVVWGLSEHQEQRYVALMRGKMGFYYKAKQTDLSPVEILGMAANSDKERDQYAEQYAKIDNDKIGRELAWSHAAFDAKRKLYTNMPMVKEFDYKPFSPYNRQPVTLKQGDSFNLFFTLSDSMSYVMTYLLRRMGENPNFTLNVYIKNATATQVQQWAHDQNIPFADVASGKITLNNQSPLFAQFKSLPYAFKVTRDDKGQRVSEVVNLGRF